MLDATASDDNDDDLIVGREREKNKKGNKGWINEYQALSVSL